MYFKKSMNKQKDNIKSDKSLDSTVDSSPMVDHGKSQDKIHDDKDKEKSILTKEKDTNLLGSKNTKDNNRDKEGSTSFALNTNEKDPMADNKDKDSHSSQKDKNLIGDHHKEKENESVANNKNKDLNNNSDFKDSNRKEKDPYSERTDKFFTSDTQHNKEKNFTRQNNLAVVIIKDVRDDRIESVK
jgi:hypothetical protein